MNRYVLTPSAKRDVNDIWDYIANDNMEAADRVLDALESAMVKLAKNPGVGQPLQIVCVLPAARDVQSILGLSPDEP
jgi:plasmid stabilization system protein ParE